MGGLGSVSAVTGAWRVTYSPLEAQVSAMLVRGNRKRQVHTSVIRFPVGLRVGQVWEGGDPPATVKALARKLVRESF